MAVMQKQRATDSPAPIVKRAYYVARSSYLYKSDVHVLVHFILKLVLFTNEEYDRRLLLTALHTLLAGALRLVEPTPLAVAAVVIPKEG